MWWVITKLFLKEKKKCCIYSNCFSSIRWPITCWWSCLHAVFVFRRRWGGGIIRTALLKVQAYERSESYLWKQFYFDFDFTFYICIVIIVLMKIFHIFFYRKSRVSTTRPEKEICRKGIDQMCFFNIDLKLNYQLLKKKITSIIQCTCTWMHPQI